MREDTARRIYDDTGLGRRVALQGVYAFSLGMVARETLAALRLAAGRCGKPSGRAGDATVAARGRAEMAFVFPIRL